MPALAILPGPLRAPRRRHSAPIVGEQSTAGSASQVRTVAVRTDRGPLHLAMPVGRVFVTACDRTLYGPDLCVHLGQERSRAWELELLCPRCERRAENADSEAALVHACRW